MKSNFTPGPWRLDPHGCGDSPAIVRVFPCGDSEPIAVPINSGFAHLQLMSSAPDLLAALERLAHPMADDDDLDYARAIIAKAKGQQ
jgi:hypothetical protein